MKTKFYWVALLASAALIGQAQGGEVTAAGMGGGLAAAMSSAGASGLDQLEAEAVSVAVASTQQPRRSVACADPLEWERAEAELASAYRATLQSGARPLYRRPVYYNGRVGRSVTPSIGARTAASRPQNRFSSVTRNPVGQRPAAAFNRPANASAARSPGTAVHRGLNGRTDHIAERHDANWWHRDWDRRHAHFFHNRFFVFDNGFWCGLDDGFFPWDYLPYYAGDYVSVQITTLTFSRTITPRPLVPIRTVTTRAFSRRITLRPLMVRRWLMPRSKLSRSGLLSWVITTVQSMAFSVRRRAMRWQSIRSTTS